jgi:hypothetical protein
LRAGRRAFGSVRGLPSGRYQACYGLACPAALSSLESERRQHSG